LTQVKRFQLTGAAIFPEFLVSRAEAAELPHKFITTRDIRMLVIEPKPL
jgi:hypothetical protein